MSEPRDLSIAEAARLIRDRELSPVELTQSVLARAETVEPHLKAFELLTSDAALAAARRAEQELAVGTYRGPLHGIPLGIKDLFATAGVPTTASSRVLAGSTPDFDAACVERLKRAGAVLVGTTRCHEFALGVTTPPARNPHDPERIPGGSSGGSAIAVVAREALGALGTDTGGSIRIPSALCGATGLKPTFGRVSRFGVLPLSWSFDHAGAIGRDVQDVGVMLSSIAGHDPRDPGSIDEPVPNFTAKLHEDVAGMRVGVPTNHCWSPIEPAVDGSVRDAIARLGEAGIELVDVELPLADSYLSIGWSIILPEASAYHKQTLLTRPDALADDVRSFLEAGQLVPATDYVAGLRARGMIRDAWHELYRAHALDAIAAPTLPATAPRVGQDTLIWPDGTEEGLVPPFARAVFAANITGLPALSVPCGTDDVGLPIGLQIIGRPFDEATVLRIGRAHELAAGPMRTAQTLV